MNIAILGASFDPPHNGHLLVANEVKRLLKCNEVWLIPAYSHPFQKKMLPIEHRLAMSKLLENDFIKVLDIEAKNPTISYSINTLTTLQRMYPSYTFQWVIGSDQVADFPKWKDWKKIITDFHLIIFQRTESRKKLKELVDATIPKDLQKKVLIVTSPTVKTSSISSSDIRNRVKKGGAIENLVPKEVESYIRKNHLYRK